MSIITQDLTATAISLAEPYMRSFEAYSDQQIIEELAYQTALIRKKYLHFTNEEISQYYALVFIAHNRNLLDKAVSIETQEYSIINSRIVRGIN